MEVVVGKLAGFCPGVQTTVEKANKILDEKEIVYCLGEIVHNKQVIEKLENRGMKTIESILDAPNGATVIFRAHGEAKEVYNKAMKKGIDIKDLTCGKVKAIHIKVEKEKDNSFIIIVGNRKHPEVIGTKGFAGDNSFVVESSDDILDAYMEYEKTNIGKVFVVAQTTFSSSEFDKISEEIKNNFVEADVIIDKTICDATSLRQNEVRALAKDLHNMIIIGGKNSANTKELAEIAKEYCKNVYHIQTKEDLKNIDLLNVDKIGIMAGASTPKESIIEVEEALSCF